MAFSPNDPVSAHSLWLQLRSTRRGHRRPQWRGDWKAVLVPLLFISILSLFYTLWLHNQVTEDLNGTIQRETVLQKSLRSVP